MSRDQRKAVTVVFCDVVESTALGERLDAEALRTVMTRWFATADDVLRHHGGTVEKFIGDAVMAVFGVPTAHEDDALRAVRAALDLRSRLDVLNADLEESVGVRLRTRTGINTGEVVAGGPSARLTLVTGDVVNTAKRLEEGAGVGEILIGERTRDLIAAGASLVPVPPLDAKGKSGPVPAWRVVAVDPGAEAIARRFDAPLVGRDAELTQLLRAAEEARSTNRWVGVVVSGQAGIGKSRLARELERSLADTMRVVTGRCPPYGTGVTYWPIRDIVAGLGGLDTAVDSLGEDAPVIRERLASAIGEESTGFGSDEIFWAVRRLIEATSGAHPLVLCIEDVHWAEPMLVDLLDYLHGWSGGAPVLALLLTRPEALEGRRVPTHDVRIDLGPLDGIETDALLLGLGIASASTRSRIADVAEGNPLFAEQIAAMLSESTSEGEGIGIPASIGSLLASRLDLLEADEREVLESGSVLGRAFARDEIAGLYPTDRAPSVGAALLALVRKGLVSPAPGEGGRDAYRFRHALIREATYGGVPKQARARLHERAAALIDNAGQATDELVGYHLEQAYRLRVELGIRDGGTDALAAQAAERLARAGRRAFMREDVSAATGLLDRAVALAPESDVSDALRLLLAQGLWEQGSSGRSLELLSRLEDRTSTDDTQTALSWRARVDLVAHRETLGQATQEDVRAVATRAIAVFEHLEDDAGLSVAWRRLAVAERRAGRYGAAVEPSERALEHARRAGNPHEQARAIDGLCTSLLYGPTPAVVAATRCRELLEAEHPNRSLRANVLSSLAGLEAMQGRFDPARAAYAEAASTYVELGLRMPLAGLTTIGVPLELLAGNVTAAEAELQRGLAILEPIGLDAELAPARVDVLLASDRVEEARRALGAPTNAHGTAWEVQWSCAQVRVAARRADGAGRAEAARGTALAESIEDPNLAGDAWLARAELELALGSQDAAEAAARRACDLFEAKGNVVSFARATVIAEASRMSAVAPSPVTE